MVFDVAWPIRWHIIVNDLINWSKHLQNILKYGYIAVITNYQLLLFILQTEFVNNQIRNYTYCFIFN